MKRLLFLSILFLLLIGTSSVFADTMSNGSYTLDHGHVGDDDVPTPTPALQKIAVPSDDLTPGYADHASHEPFSITLSSETITFDTLYPTDPVLRTSILNLVPGAAEQMTVMMREDHSLLSTDDHLIPDSTCDGGICTPHTAAPWENILTYGLGIRCDMTNGGACPGFTDKNSFMRIANQDRHEFPMGIYTADHHKTTSLSLTYKVNTSATQPNGFYQNKLNYIIVPGY